MTLPISDWPPHTYEQRKLADKARDTYVVSLAPSNPGITNYSLMPSSKFNQLPPDVSRNHELIAILDDLTFAEACERFDELTPAKT